VAGMTVDVRTRFVTDFAEALLRKIIEVSKRKRI
jgi:hypothetical protein